MAERYTRLFSLPENLYTSGAPVLIAAGALLKDNQTGKTLAQLKFKSLSEKNIKALKVTIAASDVSGNALTGVDEFQYLDLAVERNETFGQKQAIYLPNAVTRSIAAKCTELVFEDGTVWKAAEDAIWNTLPEQETIDDCLKELAAQYQRDTSRLSKYMLVEHEDLWLCTCGAINHHEEAACHRCNYEKAELLEAMDLEGLRERKAEYDKKVAEEAEQRAKEAAERAEKKAAEDKVRRTKVKKIGIIAATVVLVVVIAAILAIKVVIPNSQYNNAVALMEAGQYTEAIAAFDAMGSYKDSANKINKCNIAILDREYNDALALMESGQFIEAIAAFDAMGGYKDSANKINECNIAILDREYNDALALMESGQFIEAIAAFDAMDDYKDSVEKANSAKISLLESADVGECIIFGAYEQDNQTSNGTEAIEWIVLAIEEDRKLLVSKHALLPMPFENGSNGFISTAFSTEEKAMIPSTRVLTPNGAHNDQIFVLSVSEVKHYFGAYDSARCGTTPYAAAKGVYVNSNTGYCNWLIWDDSTGEVQDNVWAIIHDGQGDASEYETAIRPAMWIDLSALD